MSAAVVGSVVGIASGLNSIFGGSGSAGSASTYDPFANYRDQLAKMYSGALQPGAAQNINQMPGYTQFQTGVVNPAMDATKRSMAASGQFNSGGEQLALQKVGQQGYYGFMTDYLNRLAQGSGAAQNPATAAGMAQQGQLQGQASLTGGIGALSGGLQNLASNASWLPTSMQDTSQPWTSNWGNL